MQCSGFLILFKGMPLLPLGSSFNLFSPDMLDYNSFGKTSCATCVNEQQRIRHKDRLGNRFRLRQYSNVEMPPLAPLLARPRRVRALGQAAGPWAARAGGPGVHVAAP